MTFFISPLRTQVFTRSSISKSLLRAMSTHPTAAPNKNYSAAVPSEKGQFKRQVSAFRDVVSKDPKAKFPAEKGRYHLYVSWACPWAHRSLITRELKGLQDVISVNVVDWFLDIRGWSFTTPDVKPGTTPDTVNGAKYLMDLYLKADPDYNARPTVPTLWDKKTGTVVSNESSEIIRFLYTEFDEFVDDKYKGVTYYPDELATQIDELNNWTYDQINNGVYKTGFAQTQEAYDENVEKVFQGLDKIEALLEKSGGPYVLGTTLTEVDIRLYPTIIRFDVVYVQHFKCNIRQIRDGYPHIHKWLRNLYWNHDAFKNTTNFDHIKLHYTKSHRQYNPFGITPAGPVPHILPLDN